MVLICSPLLPLPSCLFCFFCCLETASLDRWQIKEKNWINQWRVITNVDVPMQEDEGLLNDHRASILQPNLTPMGILVQYVKQHQIQFKFPLHWKSNLKRSQYMHLLTHVMGTIGRRWHTLIQQRYICVHQSQLRIIKISNQTPPTQSWVFNMSQILNDIEKKLRFEPKFQSFHTKYRSCVLRIFSFWTEL